MSSATVGRFRRAAKAVGGVLVYILLWAGITLLLAGIGIRLMWGDISVDQMMLNIVTINADGGGGIVVWIAVLGFGLLPVLITLGVWFFRFRRRRRRERDTGATQPRSPSVWRRSLSGLLVALVVVGGATAFVSTVRVGQYIQSANSEYDIADYYRAPVVTNPGATAEHKNLVLIYIESGEATLSDTTLFEKDPFTPLETSASLDKGWKSIENFQQYEGGGWTMSGIVSTQCGIPLKSNGTLTGQIGLNKVDGVATYLSGQDCLGNVLKEQGYDNVFMGGAKGAFAGKGIYLHDHGYDTEYDLDTWRNKGEPADQYRSDWGLSDKRLMANARDEVDRLHAQAQITGQPFNLSMLTLDTHEPVHIYDYCDVDTEEPLTSVFQCSVQQVADFVDYMDEQGYLEDTSVVIMGDHLKHMGVADKFHDELEENPDRSIFNRIWVAGQDRDRLQVRDGVDQLNLFPTLLEAAGVQVKDRQAGLGVSVFSPTLPKNSAQALNPETYVKVLDARSKDFYQQAWGGQDTDQQDD
ncbi:MAG: LTA synthase family protein [Galactobacter sp.]